MKQRATQATAILTVATCASLLGGQALPRGRWIATWTASMYRGFVIHLNDAGFRAMGECIDLRPFVAAK